MITRQKREEMSLTMQQTSTLVTEDCISCGVLFAMPQSLKNECLRDHSKRFYCPNGHNMVYTGETEAEKERRLRIGAEARAARTEDALGMERRSVIAYKGHLTRARNKIAAGNCPVPDCGQHFSNVREHMKFKHPDYHLTDPETGKQAAL